MILLLEGLNCTGKSTLAAKFSESLSLPVVKFNVPGENPYTEFKERLLQAIQEHRHFIVDRLHLSNYAYNGRLGGGVLSPNDWSSIDGIVAQQGGLLYWMVDEPTLIEARLKERQGRNDGAEVMDRAVLADVHLRFQRAYQQSAMENKGSYTLPQFIDDGYTTAQYKHHLRLAKGIMAGVMI